jgi:hypothetical protein
VRVKNDSGPGVKFGVGRLINGVFVGRWGEFKLEIMGDGCPTIGVSGGRGGSTGKGSVVGDHGREPGVALFLLSIPIAALEERESGYRIVVPFLRPLHGEVSRRGKRRGGVGEAEGRNFVVSQKEVYLIERGAATGVAADKGGSGSRCVFSRHDDVVAKREDERTEERKTKKWRERELGGGEKGEDGDRDQAGARHKEENRRRRRDRESSKNNEKWRWRANPVRDS